MMIASLDLTQAFHTACYAMVPVTPGAARYLAGHFLRYDVVAANLPWLVDGTTKDADDIAQVLEAIIERGLCKLWGITARRDRTIVGMLIARNVDDATDIAVLIGPTVAANVAMDEVCERMQEWIDEQGEAIWDRPATLH